MKPPFDITPKMLTLCTEISLKIGKCEGLNISVPSPKLRRQNRIRSIQASLSIEGNTLSESQVTDILDNKRVIGPQKDILEVKNAIETYAKIQEFKSNKLTSLLSAHKILMNGLIDNPGKLRTQNIGVYKMDRIVHMAPKYTQVPQLIENLYNCIQKEHEIHTLILSCVFHYELEFIHPFSDGNGRMGRLWQTRILMDVHPLFEYIPIESLIKKKQKKYYDALESSDKSGKSTIFIEFMLESINNILAEFIEEAKPEPQTPVIRLKEARDHFKNNRFLRKDYMKLHKTLSTATASRDLRYGVEEKMLKKSGDKAMTTYVFVK